MDLETDTLSPSPQQRTILTRIGAEKVAFASALVSEILVVEHSQILPLPFYDPSLLGIIHHQGSMVPLVTGLGAGSQSGSWLQERIWAVRLSSAAGELAGVGVVVDQVLGSIAPQAVAPGSSLPDQPQVDFGQTWFRPEDIPAHLWQPQRWSTGMNAGA
jgi:chemotaxis signal transduction protein